MSPEKAKRWNIWIQLLLGTWDSATNPRYFLFALFIAVKFALVILPLPSILAIYYGMINLERRVGMKFMELLHIRDAAIKARILGQIPPNNKEQVEQVGKMLEDAFQQGGVDWARHHLPVILGEEVARKMVEEMEKNSL